MVDDTPDLATLLTQAAAGDERAQAELFPMVYRDLHAMALRQLRNERSGHTLQATALVNELWIRLAGRAGTCHNRQHFFAIAASVMRCIMVDYARHRSAEKRGGRATRVELADTLIVSESNCDQILLVHNALVELEALDVRQAMIVKMRYFSGMTEEEIALVLGISERTVKRDWVIARRWLRTLLEGARASPTG